MDKQMWSVHAVEGDSAIKGNEALTHASTRVDHEKMLSERSLTQTASYHWIPLR